MADPVPHTPGPWRAEYKRGHIHIVNGAKIKGAGGVHVASVTMKADKPLDQKRADAELIASAPLMRQALGPFAALAGVIGGSKDEACWAGQVPVVIRYSDIRRAAAAIGGEPYAQPSETSLMKDANDWAIAVGPKDRVSCDIIQRLLGALSARIVEHSIGLPAAGSDVKDDGAKTDDRV